jgi:hypothetical protein
MKMKLISILLTVVLSIQLLPLAQISTAMYQCQQMTEELPHNDAPSTPSLNEEIHKHFVSANHEGLMHLTELRIVELIHHAEKIYSRFSDDVQTQPPNAS